MVDMISVKLNGKWDLTLPEHRANRPEWVPHTNRVGDWVEGWEPERLDAMHAVIQPGDVIVDVGAEEGDMSALCAMWAGPTGGMILVEPNPRVWPNIRAIWNANDGLAPVADWFVGFAAAVTDLNPPMNDIGALAEWTDGWPQCAYGELIGDHGFRHLAQQADATPRIRLDDMWKDTEGAIYNAYAWDGNVDVITMDVEGSELEVIKGSLQLLAKHHPVVFVSIHPEFMRDLYGQHPYELHAYMQAAGYKSRLLATDHEQHWVYWHPDGRQA